MVPLCSYNINWAYGHLRKYNPVIPSNTLRKEILGTRTNAQILYENITPSKKVVLIINNFFIFLLASIFKRLNEDVCKNVACVFLHDLDCTEWLA